MTFVFPPKEYKYGEGMDEKVYNKIGKFIFVLLFMALITRIAFFLGIWQGEVSLVVAFFVIFAAVYWLFHLGNIVTK